MSVARKETPGYSLRRISHRAHVARSPTIGRLMAFLALVAMASAPYAAQACRDLTPRMDALDSYESIFSGEISGIRLTEFEDDRLGRPSKCDVDPADEIECIGHIAGRPRASLFVIPTKIFRGKVVDVQELQQAGCVRTDVRPKEEAIFFVYPGGNSAVIVWRSKGRAYADALQRLDVGTEDR